MKTLFLTTMLIFAATSNAAPFNESESLKPKNIKISPKKLNVSAEAQKACENIFGPLSLDGLCVNVVAVNNKIDSIQLISCLVNNIEGETYNNISVAKCLINLAN
ncbi:MAG: hypothetical protein IPM57_00270 [Oligoflexia bacterium]|nr:hypothetical protein [Oligoflexia bacterium]